jgi:hypothetical protein
MSDLLFFAQHNDFFQPSIFPYANVESGLTVTKFMKEKLMDLLLPLPLFTQTLATHFISSGRSNHNGEQDQFFQRHVALPFIFTTD